MIDCKKQTKLTDIKVSEKNKGKKRRILYNFGEY